MWRYLKMAQIKVSEGLKSWYRQLWTYYFIRNPKAPYNVSIPAYLNLILQLRCCRSPNSQMWGPRCLNISNMAQIKISEGLKSWYPQLWTDYFIRNPKSPYNVSIPGYLNLICHLRCCRCPNSQILGPKCVKISQNGPN